MTIALRKELRRSEAVSLLTDSDLNRLIDALSCAMAFIDDKLDSGPDIEEFGWESEEAKDHDELCCAHDFFGSLHATMTRELDARGTSRIMLAGVPRINIYNK